MDKRLIMIFSAFALAFMLLFMKVGSLSGNDSLAQTAAAQSKYTLSFGQTRGMIYDCKMVPMVETEENDIAACMPTPENMNALLNSKNLTGNISSLMESGRPFLTACTPSAVNIPGVKVFPVKKRSSSNQLARHVIGYLNTGGNGVTGIEKSYNDFLKEGMALSTVTYQVDGTGAPLLGIEPAVSLAPEALKGVVLTIDSRIQKIAEDAGKKYLKKGAIVVMEPSTGKIRAVASFPEYTDLSAAVKDTKNSPLINRAFSAYSVGSTFKIATAATALSQGISRELTYYCNSEIDVQGQKFKCHQDGGHGKLDMKYAMEGSCNPYYINLGLKLNIKNFLNMASDLSFGKSTEFADGLSSAAGVLPQPEELAVPAAIANFSFGQGTLTATPVQVAQMVSSVVNGGDTPFASLVEGTTQNGKLVDQGNEVPLPIKAMSKEIADELKDFMIGCVMEEPNQNAKPKYVTAGGKTGTAQTGKMKENGEELLEGWFAGFFPAENPKYVAVVLAEDARSGNQDASPVFREIVDKLYQSPEQNTKNSN